MARYRSITHESSPNLSDELVDVVRPKAVHSVVRPAFVDTGEDIVETSHLSIWIHVDHGSIHLEEGDHLLYVGIYHQRVRLPRCLLSIGAFACDPVVLQIAPFALQHERRHGLRMA